MFIVYIIYSNSLDQFYIGQTVDIDGRLSEHNDGKYARSFTSRANDWELYFTIQCTSKRQSIQIEAHIKKMKSRKYFLNLKQYPEIAIKLLDRF